MNESPIIKAVFLAQERGNKKFLATLVKWVEEDGVMHGIDKTGHILISMSKKTYDKIKANKK